LDKIENEHNNEDPQRMSQKMTPLIDRNNSDVVCMPTSQTLLFFELCCSEQVVQKGSLNLFSHQP
jgi:hypothetical protein